MQKLFPHTLSGEEIELTGIQISELSLTKVMLQRLEQRVRVRLLVLYFLNEEEESVSSPVRDQETWKISVHVQRDSFFDPKSQPIFRQMSLHDSSIYRNKHINQHQVQDIFLISVQNYSSRVETIILFSFFLILTDCVDVRTNYLSWYKFAQLQLQNTCRYVTQSE